jgi:hypothetical protein
MSGRSCRCISSLTGPIPWQWTDLGVQISVRCRWDFVYKMHHLVQVRRIWQQSKGVQNSANSCWVVLAAWAGAELVDRHSSHQDISFHQGDHMLSQKLLVDVSLDMFTGKNQPFGRVTLQDLLLIPHTMLLFTPSPGPCHHLTVFTLKNMFLLLLRPRQTFVCCCPTQSSEQSCGGKRS